MSRIMVTGVNGFVGRHLAKELLNAGHEVIGVGRRPLKPAQTKGLATDYYNCDLTQSDQVAKLPLAKVDGLIHLAGLATVSESFEKADLYRKVNVDIISNLAERCLELGLKKLRLIVVSTGAVYDDRQKPPFSEATPLNTKDRVNPYVESKLMVEEKALDYRKKGLDCIVVRPFNHIGPGQELGFLLPDLANQLQQAHQSGQTEISIGDLTKERDFLDVRDVVRAYRLLVTTPRQQLKQPIYNICSGQPHTGQDLLQLLIDAMGLESMKVKVDPSRLRPNDPQTIYGTAQSLSRDTGWQPSIPLDQTVKDFVKWFRLSGRAQPSA